MQTCYSQLLGFSLGFGGWVGCSTPCPRSPLTHGLSHLDTDEGCSVAVKCAMSCAYSMLLV